MLCKLYFQNKTKKEVRVMGTVEQQANLQQNQQRGFRFEELLPKETRQKLRAITKKIVIDLGGKKVSGIDFISRLDPAKHRIICIICEDRLSGKLGLHIENMTGRWEIVR